MLGLMRATEEATRDDEPPTLGQVAGENMRRIRQLRSITQDEVAAALKATGLFWQRSHVAALEAGNRETLDLGTLVLISRALEVPASQWFEGEGRVRLSADATVSREALREWFDSGTMPTPLLVGRRAARAAIARWGELSHATKVSFHADAELAARLGLRPEEVYTAAERLWGRNLHQEREKRLGDLGELSPGQRRAKRGHITRQLTKELEPYLPKSEQEAE